MNNYAPEMYTEEEIAAVENHIQQHFGEFPTVIHEVFSPDIHVDICLIPPTDEDDFYTLVTMGMGAHRMNVPEELKDRHIDRAELVICLPGDWDIENSDEKFYWPIRLLKKLARMPLYEDTWLGWGHTIDNVDPFAENTSLSSVILLNTPFGEESSVCRLPDGDEVNFYQLIPLYKAEQDYKIKNGTNALLEQFDELSPVVDIKRPLASQKLLLTEMDDMETHNIKIIEKDLDIDDMLAGANHLAAYLRWCIEHDLMNEDFTAKYGDIISDVKTNGAKAQLREFIRSELDGILYRELFSDEGQKFAAFYYDFYNDEYCYPCDVDNFAMEYFGEERYNCDEFKDEAYLFVPYDENYYQGMKKFIDFYYNVFRSQI